eukprot:TRINITY_DN2182_c0_g1_i1.p1 TRINITY_DN2182_c0_g1~~TRINITY_DN2182_c0_g1_i1.p1  ORF type:complete len:539 (+),score=96.54 TRINITY_DN2182_c0_g1_i1:59-1618(+)
MEAEIVLDGYSLSVDTLVDLSTGNYKIKLSSEAWERVVEGRKVVDEILASGKRVYGINTGFGKFATVPIDGDKLSDLQRNLIVSHAAGTGPPLSPERTRMLMILRINVLAKGHSGVRVETLREMVAAFNADFLPQIPEKGTVGASGDLAPLAHLALGLMGQGQAWHNGEFAPAGSLLEKLGLTPVTLTAKEGLALINGTQFITSIAAQAAFRARRAAFTADVVGAMSLESLLGTPIAFQARVHAVRPHTGQQQVAARLRCLLHNSLYPSRIYDSHLHCNRVQDNYSLRCMPQVHGISHDTIAWVESLLTTEMNSATDNPMIFAEDHSIISAGNFHGEYPAKAADYLAIGVAELANISERRIERLCNPQLSDGLPAFLVEDGGLNSGFMIAHCTAAALTSENKTLVHPASSDTISTSAAKEDHVSMGGFAARKAMTVVENVETVIAIELLAACQALDMRRPLSSTAPLEAVHALVRSVVPHYGADRFMAPDIAAAVELVQSGRVWETVLPFINKAMEANV